MSLTPRHASCWYPLDLSGESPCQGVESTLHPLNRLLYTLLYRGARWTVRRPASRYLGRHWLRSCLRRVLVLRFVRRLADFTLRPSSTFSLFTLRRACFSCYE